MVEQIKCYQLKDVFRGLILITLVLVISSCGRQGDASRRLNLRVIGIDFSDFNGRNVFTALTIFGSNDGPEESSAVVEDNGWEVFYRSALVEGIDYQLSYFVDDNRNGLCDEPPTDPGWVETITEFTSQVTLEVSVTEEQKDPCDPFQSP